MLYMYSFKSDQKYYSDKLTHARDLVAVKTLTYHAQAAIQPLGLSRRYCIFNFRKSCLITLLKRAIGLTWRAISLRRFF